MRGQHQARIDASVLCVHDQTLRTERGRKLTWQQKLLLRSIAVPDFFDVNDSDFQSFRKINHDDRVSEPGPITSKQKEIRCALMLCRLETETLGAAKLSHRSTSFADNDQRIMPLAR